MARARWAPASRRRRKRVLKKAEGYRGGRRKLYKTAKETVQRSEAYATRDRRAKKRAFRHVWVARINAACRSRGMTYSRFIRGLKAADIALDRKQLAELAQHDATAFAALVQLASHSTP